MAKLTEANQKGKRQDLRDIIAMIDARKYPLSSMAKKGMAPKNSMVEWQADGYPDPSFDGVKDGEDVTVHENMAEQREMLYGRIQQFRRSPMVSLLAEEVSDVAGIGNKKEMARSIAKSIEMVKRDMECAFCSDRDSQAEAGGNAFRTRGLGEWIKATAQTDLPVPEPYRTPATSITTNTTANTTENTVNDIVASIWDKSGEDKNYVLLCGRALRSRFTAFTMLQTGSTNVMSSVRVFNQDAETRKLVNTIDVLEGDFGTIELVPSAWLARDNASEAVRRARGYLLDMDLIEILYHTAPKRKPLPDLGGGPRELIYAIASLCVKSPLGLGKFAGTE